MNVKHLIFTLVLVSALLAGVFVATKMNSTAEPRSAFIIPTPGELPNFSLLDQTGAAVTAETFRGQWDLVFFGFTHCPDICPATLQILAGVRRELAARGAKTLPRIVLVSVDPERDTPEVLGQYVDYFGTGNLAVTGDLEAVTQLTSALGIYFGKVPGDNNEYSVDHSAAVLLLDPQARFSALFSAPHVAADYLYDLPIIMGHQ